MRSQRLLVVTVVVLLGAIAKDSPNQQRPKSQKAVAAIQKFEHTLKDAEAGYAKVQRDAEKTLVAELKAAQKIAFKNEDAPEVKAIEEAIQNAGIERAHSNLAEKVPGNWKTYNNLTGQYRADGTFRFGDAAGRWEEIEANTIRMKEDTGVTITVTLNASQTMGFWVYEHNALIGWAKRLP